MTGDTTTHDEVAWFLEWDTRDTSCGHLVGDTPWRDVGRRRGAWPGGWVVTPVFYIKVMSLVSYRQKQGGQTLSSHVPRHVSRVHAANGRSVSCAQPRWPE